VVNADFAIDYPPIRTEKLLEVVVTFFERIREALRYTSLEQMQNDLRVFRIVLVPRVEQCLTGAMTCDRRNEMNVMPLA